MTRTAWECPRWQRVNAPHVDHCDCKPDALVPFKPYDSGGTISVTSPTTIAITTTMPKPHTYYVS